MYCKRQVHSGFFPLEFFLCFFYQIKKICDGINYRYFGSKETEAKMPVDRKSKCHRSNGPLKDPIIDDSKNFITVDQVIICLPNLKIIIFKEIIKDCKLQHNRHAILKKLNLFITLRVRQLR